jgi:3-carboxy-cis,cis-muconate cycloisomerase
LRLALGAAGLARELVEGLQVFPEAMRRNLDLSGPLLLSEAVASAVAPLLGEDGRKLLQSVVDKTLLAPAAERSATYRRLLRETVAEDKLSDHRLEELLDPANYLGQSHEIARRIFAAFPEFSGKPAQGTEGIPV